MDLLPLFLNLTGRAVVLVGGGPVATAKLRQLLAAGARVRVVAPEITDEIEGLVASRAVVARPSLVRDRSSRVDVARGFQPLDRGPERAAPQPEVTVARRPFVPADLDEAWLVVAAATSEVNRHVAEVAEARRLFVNAVDDPANASAFLSGVVRRDGVTLAISTHGAAPALTALLREGLDALLPRDLATWMWQARAARAAWRREGVPMAARKPHLLEALNGLYRPPPLDLDPEELRRGSPKRGEREGGSPEGLRHGVTDVAQGSSQAVPISDGARGFPPPFAVDRCEPGRGLPTREEREGGSPAVPWLNGPENSWL